MPRLLGIDYGTKRIGIALTNEDGTMAFPHTTIENTDSTLSEVIELIEEKDVTEVVVGLSHTLEGTPNVVQSGVQDFVEALVDKTGLPTRLEPEQFTTRAAERVQGKTEHTDASAAALILDSYIQKHSNS